MGVNGLRSLYYLGGVYAGVNAAVLGRSFWRNDDMGMVSCGSSLWKQHWSVWRQWINEIAEKKEVNMKAIFTSFSPVHIYDFQIFIVLFITSRDYSEPT